MDKILRNKVLSYRDIIVYLILKSFIKDKDGAFISIPVITSIRDMDTNMLFHSIRNLEGQRIIEVIREKGKINFYKIILQSSGEKTSGENETSDDEFYDNNIYNNIYKNIYKKHNNNNIYKVYKKHIKRFNSILEKIDCKEEKPFNKKRKPLKDLEKKIFKLLKTIPFYPFVEVKDLELIKNIQESRRVSDAEFIDTTENFVLYCEGPYKKQRKKNPRLTYRNFFRHFPYRKKEMRGCYTVHGREA